jgi:hypothetical protein
MEPGQDWCLQCGAGMSGSVGAPGWRSTVTILGAVAVLALAAAAAAYAALSTGAPHAHVLTKTIAQVTPPPATPTPPVTTPPPATTLPPSAKTALPPVSAKVPKIPLQTPTPKALPVTPAPKATTPAATTPATTTPTSSTGGTSGEGEGPQPNALVLDTNSASTYNPYGYPQSNFGDPTLAIDGDTSTGWTALATPPNAPRMAVGLLLDLKTAQRLAAVELVTSTPGLTIQLYGANGTTVPSSITDPAWKRLTKAMVLHKRHEHLTLSESAHSFRYVTVWVSRAPSAASKPTKPIRVSINEVELLPAG